MSHIDLPVACAIRFSPNIPAFEAYGKENSLFRAFKKQLLSNCDKYLYLKRMFFSFIREESI
jgi:hypothetical protein